jgi:diadenylate cyclase
MAIFDYLCSDEIFEIETDDKDKALEDIARELCRNAKIKPQKPVIEEMMTREESSSTFIGQGVAMPQSEAKMKDDFSLIVGRSAEGIKYGARNAKAHIFVFVVSKIDGVDEEGQIEFFSELSSFFKDETVNRLIIEDGVDSIAELVKAVSREDAENGKKSKKEPLISAATALARDVSAKAIIIFADSKIDNEFIKFIKARRQVIIITSNKSRFESEKEKYDIIQAPAVRTSGQGQIKIGVLLAMSRNLLNREDSVVCVFGKFGSDQFDSLSVVDINQEFDFFFNATRSLIPEDVKPEVLERVLGIASEIGMEGREGKSLGTIFVLGDTNQVNKHLTQLIINPFRGYSESERNVMDPGLEETIKEFASIDGAFVITGDGVVLSAGSYLRPIITENSVETELPSGLGARHSAAAGITNCSNAIAITISESTGQVTVFKNGAIALTLSKPIIY